MLRAVTFSFPASFRVGAEIPSGPLPDEEEPESESTHSSRLHQIYTPPETCRNDVDGSCEFHGEAAVE